MKMRETSRTTDKKPWVNNNLKTTRLINPLLLQLLKYEDVGGLIFDIKGDFQESVNAFAGRYHRPVHRIGVGEDCQGVNLLKGLTPEQAAGFLQSKIFN